MNGEEKPRQRRSDALINRLLETHFLALFYTASALSAPSGHLPLEGKAKAERRYAPKSLLIFMRRSTASHFLLRAKFENRDKWLGTRD